MLARTRLYLRSYLLNVFRSSDNVGWLYSQRYAKGDDCSKAFVDIPPEEDPICPKPCDRRPMKKKGILHKFKLKMIEGGTNFGSKYTKAIHKHKFINGVIASVKTKKPYVTLSIYNPAPFRKLDCKKEKPSDEQQIALPEPKPELPLPPSRPGVQVSVLGADTAMGQYIALLLKQCSSIKKLRLYEAKDSQGCARDLNCVVQDLQHINTNCLIQAFSCSCDELERCLQNSDIVLILESGYLNHNMSYQQRFSYQAPIVKCYADAIAHECPKAFIIVCASPIDCMVPLIAMTMNETGWYNPRKLLGSLAVPEMRASTLAARALTLEPMCTRVPCVGGTEGEALVPLFSRAVEFFEFSQHNAVMMTEAVRNASLAVSRIEGPCAKSSELSEAHAVAGLVAKVASALICQDVPMVSGFVEADLGEVVSPARFIGNPMEINGHGISRNLGLPKMIDYEAMAVDLALNDLYTKRQLVECWYNKYCASSTRLEAFKDNFFSPSTYKRFEDCAYCNL